MRIWARNRPFASGFCERRASNGEHNGIPALIDAGSVIGAIPKSDTDRGCELILTPRTVAAAIISMQQDHDVGRLFSL